MSRSIANMVKSNSFTLIAEIGVNYYDIADKEGISLMEAAKLMCREARDAGIHAVKFQTYKAEALASRHSPSYWDTDEEATTSQFELFKKYDSFDEEQYRELSGYCGEIGIGFCSTAFDFESADYLDALQDVYKVSSSDLTNLPFIEYQASKGKTVILSVGAGDLTEISRAVDTIRKVNDKPVVLCHCVLEYPTPYEHANLQRIRTLAQCFPDVIIGYSDHCKPNSSMDVVKTAYLLGASVVEKHFTLDKTLPGNDHYHAMDPDDARRALEGIATIDRLLGNGDLIHLESEQAARSNARRSIVAKGDIAAGTVLSANHLIFKRPGTGISPKDVAMVVGKKALCNIADDTIIQLSMLS